MDKITETTRIVKIMDFVQEHPPAVLISETVPGPGGRTRLFTQKVQVPDIALWEKLTNEVDKGESIQATIKTIWPDSSAYYTCLDGFMPIITSSAAPVLATTAT